MYALAIGINPQSLSCPYPLYVAVMNFDVLSSEGRAEGELHGGGFRPGLVRRWTSDNDIFANPAEMYRLVLSSRREALMPFVDHEPCRSIVAVHRQIWNLNPSEQWRLRVPCKHGRRGKWWKGQRYCDKINIG